MKIKSYFKFCYVIFISLCTITTITYYSLQSLNNNDDNTSITINNNTIQNFNKNITSIQLEQNNNFTLTIVTLGDSLSASYGSIYHTFSWQYDLEQLLIPYFNVTIANLSIAGWNMQDLLLGGLINNKKINKLQPRIITLLIGTNDLHRNLSYQTFIQEYTTIIDAIYEQYNKTKLFIITLPPISTIISNVYQSYAHIVPNYNKWIRKIPDMYNNTNIDIIDLYKNITTVDLMDGIHLFQSGNQKLAQLVFDKIIDES